VPNGEIEVVSSGNPTSNEPSGFVQRLNQSFGTLASWFNLTGSTTTVALDTDATDPASPSDVIKWTFPAGNDTGGQPGRDFFVVASPEIYVAATWKLSNPWDYHPSTVNKMFFIWLDGSATNNDLVISLIGSSAANAQIRYASQAPPPAVDTNGYLAANIATVLFTLGMYHLVEVYLKNNSAPGVADGIVKVWVDGVLTSHYTNQEFNGNFRGIRWQHYWGGGAATRETTDHAWDGHLYASTP
jgi:hypothetical protein